MRVVVLLGAVVAAAVLFPGSAASGRQKRHVLTALARIGTVYWRYDCVHHPAPEWSLGIHVFENTATTRGTFRAGRVTMHRTIQPGKPTTWFPFRREHRQTLSLLQGTEPGTVHGHVLVRFSRGNCWSGFPPRLNVQLYPR